MGTPQQRMLDGDRKDNAVLDYRVTNLEEKIERITKAAESMAENAQLLARLEERHSNSGRQIDRAFEAITELTRVVQQVKEEGDRRLSDAMAHLPDDADKRLRDLELKMPKDLDTRLRALEAQHQTNKKVSGWVMAGMVGLVVLVALALLRTIGLGK